MKEKLLQAELIRNAESLVSALDQSHPVGLDVGALIPALRLLEAGLPGCDRWSFSLTSVGPVVTVSKRLEGKWLDATVRLTWEQCRLYMSGPDVFLRQNIASLLRALEEKASET